MQIQRHVGKTKTTGQKIVVIFRQIPNGEGLKPDSDHCLIVQTSQLPDLYHDNLLKVVDSAEAQQTHNLYDILSSRMFADGNPMLPTLHKGGYLKKMSVDEIVLHPGPHMTLPLREANNAIDGVNTSNQSVQAPKPGVPISKDDFESLKALARGKITQAELLEQEATKFREDAYLLDPSLRPTVGRPEDSAEVKATKLVSKNERRRERYKLDKDKAKTSSKS